MKTNCNVCFRRCELEEGQTGACGARRNVNGTVTASNYGRLTALALDPIEKKPLARFCPGSNILSVGSYGCSLRCPFCQNYEIASAREEKRREGAEGPAPVAFRDGNRLNTDISNLALIDKSVNVRLNHMGIRHAEDPQLFDTAVLVAKVAAEAGRKKHEHTRNRR